MLFHNHASALPLPPESPASLPNENAKTSVPTDGWGRVKYYGPGYYMGLVAAGLAVLVFWGHFRRWDAPHAHDNFGPYNFARLDLYGAVLTFDVLLALGGLVWSVEDVTKGRAQSGRGVWLNLITLVAFLLLSQALFRGYAVA